VNSETAAPKRDIADRTFAFAVQIVKLCRELERKDSSSRILAGQVLRSGTSVGANVEEAQASQSPADFLSKCSIACKEARETHFWLKVLVEAGILPVDQVSSILDECNQIVAILTTIVKKVKHRTR
jgi:four helix bundle protein